MKKNIWDEFEEEEEENEPIEEKPSLKKTDTVEPIIRKLSIGEPPMKTHEQLDWGNFPEDEEVYENANKPEGEESESWGKTAARTGLQVASGVSQAYTYPLDIFKIIAQGSAYSDMDDFLKHIPEEEQEEFKKKYLETLNEIDQYFPTQGNLERIAEEKYGVPLAPKNELQKIIRLGSTAGGFAKGGLLQKGSAAVTAPTVSQGLQTLGLPEGASDFVGLGASQIPYAIGQRTKSFFSNKEAGELEGKLTGEGLPKSSYEPAEQALEELRRGQPRRYNLNFPPDEPPPGGGDTGGGGGNLTNRVSRGAENLPVRPPRTPLELEEEVRTIFSPNRYRNAAEGGVANIQEIRNLDQQVYRGVSELYTRSRALNEGIETIHPQLDAYVTTVINNIERIPEPSDIQRRLLRAAENIRNSLSVRDAQGDVRGYRPINNQALIDQVQSLRSIIDYDFQHGGAKNIFRPLIEEIQTSAIEGARSTGNLEAVAANQEARRAYASWANTFDNDYIRPFRDTSNHDYIKLYESLQNPDKFNQVSHVLDLSPRGQELAKADISSIVEQKVGKFLKNPRKADTKEFNQALRDLESVAGVSGEQVQQVRNLFNQAKKSPNFAARPEGITTAQQSAAKYAKKKPEDIQNMLNSRSGIKELRQDLSRTETGRKLFDINTRQKMRSILRDGNIEKEFTGNELYQFLNKENNFELFSEIIGEEATEAARQTAKKIGKKQMKSETVKKLGGKAATVKFLHSIAPLLL